MASEPNQSLSYRGDIDGMRAIAVLLVLIFHFALIPAGDAGFMGVDVFFVISGFLITAVINKQLERGSFSLATFYVHRIRRLAPPLFVVLILCLGIGAVWLFPAEFIDLAKQVLVTQFYVSNFFFWRTVNYFGLGGNDVYLLHTWSLAVEEQFYLLYPLFLIALNRTGRVRILWAGIILGMLVSFGLNVLLVGSKAEAVFYLLPFRGWELLIGALTYLISQIWSRKAAVDEVLGWIGILLLLGAVAGYRTDIHFPGFYALLPTGGAALLLLSGQSPGCSIARALSWAPSRFIGRISYSLYLVHWPINIFAKAMILDYSLAWRLGMFALSFVLATAIYYTVEQPVRLRRVFAAGSRLVSGYLIGLLGTAALGAWILMLHGIPQRFPTGVIRLADFVADHSAPLAECEFPKNAPAKLDGACRIGTPGRAATWMIYGDSHAWAAHSAFDTWLRQHDQAGLFVFLHGCPPLLGVHLVGDQDRCFLFNERVYELVKSDPALTNVVLVSTWRQAIEDLLSNSTSTLSTPDQSVQLFAEHFSETVDQLHRLNRSVYVWEPLPGAKGNVPIGLARAMLTHAPADLAYDRTQYLATYQFFFDALSANCKSVTATFSPAAQLCASGKCAVELDGSPLYSDNGHITDSTVGVWVGVLNRPHPQRCP